MRKHHMTDKELIQTLGGPIKVCELLGYETYPRGYQRVRNWMDRGIPAKVKLEHPDVFLKANK
jgi:hypothetical protein